MVLQTKILNILLFVCPVVCQQLHILYCHVQRNRFAAIKLHFYYWWIETRYCAFWIYLAHSSRLLYCTICIILVIISVILSFKSTVPNIIIHVHQQLVLFMLLILCYNDMMHRNESYKFLPRWYISCFWNWFNVYITKWFSKPKF